MDNQGTQFSENHLEEIAAKTAENAAKDEAAKTGTAQPAPANESPTPVAAQQATTV